MSKKWQEATLTAATGQSRSMNNILRMGRGPTYTEH